MGAATVGNGMLGFLKKNLNIEFTYDPAIPQSHSWAHMRVGRRVESGVSKRDLHARVHSGQKAEAAQCSSTREQADKRGARSRERIVHPSKGVKT